MKSIVLGKVLATALFFAVSLSSNAQSISHEAEVVDQFFATMINVPSKVQFVKGEAYSVDVIAEDAEVSKGVKYQVVDGILYIYLNNAGMDAERIESGEITIVITTPTAVLVKTSKGFEVK